jgi:hypothetical protein
MEETELTGVVYMVTNVSNNKKYIGKAYSYVKNGNQPIRRQGGEGRFYKHIKAATRGCTEIPLLYSDIRLYGKDNFKVGLLEVCLKENLKERETYHIRHNQTYKEDIGYNFHIGDNKPEDISHKKAYEDKKVESNKTRAEGGALRQSADTVDLPPNIYRRKNGLFAQIKIGSNLYNKAFFKSLDTDEIKLEKALAWLDLTKQQNEI